MGGALSELTITQLFSQKQTLHEAPLHLRAKGPSTRGSLLLLLGFWGLWVLLGWSSPSLGSGHSGGSCPLLSAHSVSWSGFWTGPWRWFSSLHKPYWASPPSCAPRSLCLPQTCSWTPPAPPLRWSHSSVSAAVLGVQVLKAAKHILLDTCTTLLKHNTNHCLEGWAQTWIPNLLGCWTSNFHLMANYQFCQIS